MWRGLSAGLWMPRRGRQLPTETHRLDWEKLFDGHAWECVRGVDFDGEPTNFRHYVLQRARAAGVQVKTRVKRKNGRQSVWVQKTSDVRPGAARARTPRDVPAPPRATDPPPKPAGQERDPPDTEHPARQPPTTASTETGPAPEPTKPTLEKPKREKRKGPQPPAQPESLFDLPQPDDS
jgi:hypothetical protein